MQALVTGGAGFIGSHLVDRLIVDGHRVRVLDDLSTGYRDHVNAAAELVEGDVSDERAVSKATAGADIVFHHAAHKAVFRSVEHPLSTDRVNTFGTLAVLQAAREASVRRVVFASSSSIYGGAAELPTPETAPSIPRSPYAVTKVAGEHYCRVFSELFGLETVALRYFNVYGPRQRPDSAYAAVIPLFIDALRGDGRPEVHGDGHQSRDFTLVDDAVEANVAAATAPAEKCSGRAYNIAGGRTYSLLDLLDVLGRHLDRKPLPIHVDSRAGDVRYSQADVAAATADLGFVAKVSFDEGLRRTVEWFAHQPSPAVA